MNSLSGYSFVVLTTQL